MVPENHDYRGIGLLTESFLKLGIKVPEILTPRNGVDLYKWAVVACDQYTSEPDYWDKVAAIVGDAPSTLNLVFPEAYLGRGAETERISRIHGKMREYLEQGIIVSHGAGFVYVERRTSRGASRRGLILAVDLDNYDYQAGAETLIRTTEGTVLERIPPRVRIREGAPLELPHVMLLIDDPDRRVIEPLAAKTGEFECLYDTDLMMGGGHVGGFLIKAPAVWEEIYRGLAALAEPGRFNEKYGVVGKAPFLFAVGDGNHSLAAAKAVWEKTKRQPGVDPEDHPARYALVEVVNIHDPGLQFEPIHRVLFNVAAADVLAAMRDYFGAERFGFERLTDRRAMEAKLQAKEHGNRHLIGFVDDQGYGTIWIADPQSNLEVGTLQAFLDQWLERHPGAGVDYIHGDEVVSKLGSRRGNIGFFLLALEKNALFKTVLQDGALPRKSFSMGEADEKRFYLECRRIG